MPTQTPLLSEAIRQHITGAKCHFGSVEFLKKDGTLRRLTFQQAAMPARIKGTARGNRWSFTMATRHPHLVRVWSVHDRGFRTVNLDTVLNVTTHRQTVTYRRLPPRDVFLYMLHSQMAMGSKVS